MTIVVATLSVVSLLLVALFVLAVSFAYSQRGQISTLERRLESRQETLQHLHDNTAKIGVDRDRWCQKYEELQGERDRWKEEVSNMAQKYNHLRDEHEAAVGVLEGREKQLIADYEEVRQKYMDKPAALDAYKARIRNEANTMVATLTTFAKKVEKWRDSHAPSLSERVSVRSGGAIDDVLYDLNPSAEDENGQTFSYRDFTEAEDDMVQSARKNGNRV